jgi:hypothetical protein
MKYCIAIFGSTFTFFKSARKAYLFQNRKEIIENKTEKEKGAKLDWTKCTVHWPSPAGPTPLSPSRVVSSLAEGALAAPVATPRRHRRRGRIRATPIHPPWAARSLSPSPRSLRLSLLPQIRRARALPSPRFATAVASGLPTPSLRAQETRSARPRRLLRRAEAGSRCIERTELVFNLGRRRSLSSSAPICSY